MPALPNNAVTRLPSGITNVDQNSIFADLFQLVPTLAWSYMNDFFAYASADWTVTATGSTTQALTAGNGGQLLLTNSAANNDLLALQKNPAMQLLDSTKKAWFSARFKVSQATLISWVMGMQVIDTTPLDVTDGIYFLKSAGATTVDIICRKDASTGSTSASAITTTADDTFITLEWYYNGDGMLYYAVNGTVKGSLNVASYFPDTATTVSFAIQNGSAAARTMTLDWVLAIQER